MACRVDGPLEARCTGSWPAARLSILSRWDAGWEQQQTLDSPAKPDLKSQITDLITDTTESFRMNVGGSGVHSPAELIRSVKIDGTVVLKAHVQHTLWIYSMRARAHTHTHTQHIHICMGMHHGMWKWTQIKTAFTQRHKHKNTHETQEHKTDIQANVNSPLCQSSLLRWWETCTWRLLSLLRSRIKLQLL